MISLEDRVSAIERRNKQVEMDKGWETSWARRILLALFTYLAIGFYLRSIEIGDPWKNAIVPSIGFLLSTLTLPWFKAMWIKYVYRK